MPKIPNWPRKDDLSPDGSNTAWIHEQTGEMIYISAEINNEYRIMAVPPSNGSPDQHDGEVVATREMKKPAIKKARFIMRVSPNGVVDSHTEKQTP